jgi:hypothetical protein
MENDSYLPSSALQLCWRAEPDVDTLLRDTVPPISSVYLTFLDFLTSKKETNAAAKVWAQLAQLHQPVEACYIFEYMRYLIGQREVDQALLVWQQSASLCRLSAYQPSTKNLVINGDFSLPVLKFRQSIRGGRNRNLTRPCGHAFRSGTVTLPSSMATALPSNLTKESERITLEPKALMFARESGLVCTISPGKTAEVFGTPLPLSHVVPFA